MGLLSPTCSVIQRESPLNPRSHGQAAASGGSFLLAAGGEMAAELQVAPASELDERSPDGAGQAPPDQEVPEPVRALVEIGHRQVRRDGAPVARAAVPDRSV